MMQIKGEVMNLFKKGGYRPIRGPKNNTPPSERKNKQMKEERLIDYLYKLDWVWNGDLSSPCFTFKKWFKGGFDLRRIVLIFQPSGLNLPYAVGEEILSKEERDKLYQHLKRLILEGKKDKKVESYFKLAGRK